MKNWIMNFFVGQKVKNLSVGSRVRIRGERGVIVGGSLSIKFDRTNALAPLPVRVNHPNNLTAAVNLSNPDLEIL